MIGDALSTGEALAGASPWRGCPSKASGTRSISILIATSSPVGSTALRGASFKAIMAGAFTDFAGMPMLDASSEGIDGTGLWVSFASLTALVLGYTNSCPQLAPG